jgi:ABC-type amino acid transport substrate-binding protein
MKSNVARFALAGAALICVAAAFAGAAGARASGVNPKVAAEVPQKYKSKTLMVAADATYAPNEFIASNGHTVVGMDPDLAVALAGVMGIKVKVVNATFDSIIPGLQAGKYDLGMSSFTDTKARQKVVDFVTYFSAGTSFYVKAQGGPAISSLASLCGHKVAVEKGTTQQADSTAQSAKCTKAGKSAVSVSSFPDQNGVNLALSSGRADVAMADSPALERACRRRDGRLARGRLSGEAVARRVQDQRQVVRDGALRDRDPEGERAREADSRRPRRADQEREVQADPHEVGHPAGSDLEPEDQRRHQLKAPT